MCEAACMNAALISYWDLHRERMANANPDERARLDREAQAEWDHIESGRQRAEERNRCLASCIEKGEPAQIQCLIDATGLKDLRRCMSVDLAPPASEPGE